MFHRSTWKSLHWLCIDSWEFKHTEQLTASTTSAWQSIWGQGTVRLRLQKNVHPVWPGPSHIGKQCAVSISILHPFHLGASESMMCKVKLQYCIMINSSSISTTDAYISVRLNWRERRQDFLSLWTYSCIISSQQYYLLLLSGSHCLGLFVIIWRVDEVLLSCLWLEKELLHWYFQSLLACKEGIQSLLNLHLTHKKEIEKFLLVYYHASIQFCLLLLWRHAQRTGKT